MRRLTLIILSATAVSLATYSATARMIGIGSNEGSVVADITTASSKAVSKEIGLNFGRQTIEVTTMYIPFIDTNQSELMPPINDQYAQVRAPQITPGEIGAKYLRDMERANQNLQDASDALNRMWKKRQQARWHRVDTETSFRLELEIENSLRAYHEDFKQGRFTTYWEVEAYREQITQFAMEKLESVGFYFPQTRQRITQSVLRMISKYADQAKQIQERNRIRKISDDVNKKYGIHIRTLQDSPFNLFQVVKSVRGEMRELIDNDSSGAYRIKEGEILAQLIGFATNIILLDNSPESNSRFQNIILDLASLGVDQYILTNSLVCLNKRDHYCR